MVMNRLQKRPNKFPYSPKGFKAELSKNFFLIGTPEPHHQRKKGKKLVDRKVPDRPIWRKGKAIL
jgi:hypothetical protein